MLAMRTMRTACLCVVIALLLAPISAPVARATPWLLSTDFNSDTPGQLPSGWAVSSGAINPANTKITDTLDHGRVFQVGETGESFTVGVNHTPFSLSTPS